MRTFVTVQILSCLASTDPQAKHPFRAQYLFSERRKIHGTDQFIETTEVRSCSAEVEVARGMQLLEIVHGNVDGKPWMRVIAVIKDVSAIAAMLKSPTPPPATTAKPAAKGE
jgi:hypothetical protein